MVKLPFFIRVELTFFLVSFLRFCATYFTPYLNLHKFRHIYKIHIIADYRVFCVILFSKDVELSFKKI